jgi:hypothetical protein
MDETERAESLSRDLLELAGGDPRTEHFALHFLADCALLRGDCEEAERSYRKSLRAAVPLGDVVETGFEVQGVAMSLAGLGDSERALVLAGAVDAYRRSLGVSTSMVFWDALLGRYIGAAREALGAEAEGVWVRGSELTFDDAIALALTPRPS